MSLAWRELDSAIRDLAGPGTQRDRLQDACRHVLLALRKKELPAEIRGDYDLLCVALGRPHADPASLERAVREAGEAEMQAAIDAIIRMHDAVTRYQPIPLVRPVRA